MARKSYEEVYASSLSDRERFWSREAGNLCWDRTWDRVIDERESPHNMWFEGGMCNVCENAVDRHVEAGRGGETAIIYDSAMTGEKTRMSYEVLRRKVAKTAGMLRSMGVEKGDRVVIYMPMIVHTIIGMLACARIGAVHSVVFGGFVAKELASRIEDSGAKVVLTASCGFEPGRVIDYMEIVRDSVSLLEGRGGFVSHVVVFQREGYEVSLEGDAYKDWDEFYEVAEEVGCVPVEASHPLYILYTSGSTGLPKGIERASGGHMVALLWSMRYIYGCEAGDVFWAASDFGWIVGHSYIVYGPLLAGCTTVVYEGKPVRTPDAGSFFRVIEEYGVQVMFTAPTAYRAIRREDPDGKLKSLYDLGTLRAQFFAGERCDVGTLLWIREQLGVPVIDHWWQTETGWAITSDFLGLSTEREVKEGSAGLPVPGYEIMILDEASEEVPNGELGDVCIKLPLPPSFMTGLWGSRDRFEEVYMRSHPGFYTTGDAGYKDEDGCIFIMARTDDVINVAGHRLSTSAIEESLISYPSIVEAAAVGMNDELKGQIPVAFVVRGKEGAGVDDESLVRDVIKYIREEMGAVTALHKVMVVGQLPKTRSGKILRGTLQKMLNGESYTISPTIEDERAIEMIAAMIDSEGLSS